MASRDDVIIRFGGDARGVDKTLNTIRASFKSSFSDISKLAGTLGVGFGIASFVRSISDSVVALDAMERGFAAVTGSQAAAAKEMEYVKVTADRLGLELLSTADAYLSLMAAAKGTALEGEPARRIFEAVSAAMSRLGKSAADTQGALLAIQQMISKGKVSAEELRGQLGERLPGAFQAAARAMHVTTAELGNMLQGGNLVAEDLLPKLAAELEKTGKSSERVDSLTASINRLKNTLTGFAGVIKESILAPAIVDLNTLLAGYERLGILLSHWASGDYISPQQAADLTTTDAQRLQNELEQTRTKVERLQRQISNPANAGKAAWLEGLNNALTAAKKRIEELETAISGKGADKKEGATSTPMVNPSKSFTDYTKGLVEARNDAAIKTKSIVSQQYAYESRIAREYLTEQQAIRKNDVKGAEEAQAAQEAAFKKLADISKPSLSLDYYQKLVGEMADNPIAAKMKISVDRTEVDGLPKTLDAVMKVTPLIQWGDTVPGQPPPSVPLPEGQGITREADQTGANP